MSQTETKKTERPNIILITADQWRGDCLGYTGHPDVKTPYLDSLCQSGVCFDRAYSATPTCIPARAALHTGMSQEHHGRVGYRDGIRWNYKHTLAGELTKAGYYTQCVGKMHVHPLRSSLGFMNIELHDGYLHYYRNDNTPRYTDQRTADDYVVWLKRELGENADITDTGIDCNSWLARPWTYPEYTHPTVWATDRAIDFLRRRDRDMPFFLNLSYVRPHPPLDASKEFFDMYENQILSGLPSDDWSDIDRQKRFGRRFDSDTGPYDPELIRRARVGYYACITQIDYQLGRLLEALNSSGCAGNTVIMFTSDHGEMLCDHRMFRKSVPYEGSAHVPMLISGGGLPKSALSADTSRLIELRDVMPTLLSIAGAEIPDTVDGLDILGDEKRGYIHGEHLNGELSNQYIVTDRDKYIWFTQKSVGSEQYFDLSSDRSESHNAIDDEDCRERIGELREILIRELSEREEGFVSGGKLVTGRPQNALLSFLRDK